MSKFVERPRYVCSLGGAVGTIKVLPRTVPILHAATGCGGNVATALNQAAGYFWQRLLRRPGACHPGTERKRPDTERQCGTSRTVQGYIDFPPRALRIRRRLEAWTPMKAIWFLRLLVDEPLFIHALSKAMQHFPQGGSHSGLREIRPGAGGSDGG